MKVDFNVGLLDPRGKPAINGMGVPHLLADTLIDKLSQKADPITARKAMGYVKKLVSNEVLELDDADFRDLYSFIENDKDLFNFAKIQMLDAMDLGKENSKSPPLELVK